MHTTYTLETIARQRLEESARSARSFTVRRPPAPARRPLRLPRLALPPLRLLRTRFTG